MAVVVIVTHLVQPGRMEEGAARIDANGARMAGRPGFVSREVLVPLDGSEQLVTVTRWADEASYRAWVAENQAAAPPDGAPSPWAETPTTVVLRAYAPGAEENGT